MKKWFVLLLPILLVACNNEEDNVSDASVDVEEPKQEDVEESIEPDEFTSTFEGIDANVSYDESTKTFIFELPSYMKDELINEDNDYYSDDEYEDLIARTKNDMVETSMMIVDYYDRSYTVVYQLDTAAKDILIKYEDGNLVENNLDMRHLSNNVGVTQDRFASDKEKQLYDTIGDYIYLDYRDYFDTLEGLITNLYDNNITEDVFVAELTTGHSELTHYCTNLLSNASDESGDVLSDDISKLMSNAFLSCTSLQSAYFNLTLSTSDGVEASEILEESIEYLEIAKNIYDNY